MNWEYINEYAWETLGQVRTCPLSSWEKMTSDGRAYDEPRRSAQTNNDWRNDND